MHYLLNIFVVAQAISSAVLAFTPPFTRRSSVNTFSPRVVSTVVHASTEEKVAQDVTGEQLELMLTEWDQPLIVDAYATW